MPYFLVSAFGQATVDGQINFTSSADIGGTAYLQPLVAAATGPGGSTDVPVFLPGPAGVSSGGAGDMCQQPDLPGPVPVAPPGGKKAAKVAQQPKANKKQQQQHLQQGTDLAAAAAEFEAVAHAANGQAVNQPLPSHVDVLSAAAVAAGVSPTTLNKQVK